MLIDLNRDGGGLHPGPPPKFPHYDKRAWHEWYRRYLLSSDWQMRREAVMQRAGGFCEGCRAHTATQVHHLTYDHVGYELLWELVAVCSDCHKRVHSQRRGWK